MLTKIFIWVENRLNQGWVSRGLLLAQFYLAFKLTSWAMSYAVIAINKDADLIGTSAVIAAVAAAPQALLMLATNAYINARKEKIT